VPVVPGVGIGGAGVRVRRHLIDVIEVAAGKETVGILANYLMAWAQRMMIITGGGHLWCTAVIQLHTATQIEAPTALEWDLMEAEEDMVVVQEEDATVPLPRLKLLAGEAAAEDVDAEVEKMECRFWSGTYLPISQHKTSNRRFDALEKFETCTYPLTITRDSQKVLRLLNMRLKSRQVMPRMK